MFWQRSVSSLSSWRRRFHTLAPLPLCPPAPPLQTAVRELTLLSLSAVSWGAIALPAAALCPGQLGTAIDLVIARPEMARARLGIQVSTLDGERVYGRDSDRFFVPASTLKLLTTAAVLTQLGPDAQIRTSVYGETAVNGLTTLRVVGRGDPSFSTDDITALGDQLQAQGIQQVSQLIGDESAFPGSATNPNWEWEDVQAGYGAPVNALILNENEIGLTLTPQAVGQPLQVVWDNPALAATWLVANQSRTVAAGSPEFISVGRDLGQPVLRVAGQLVAGSQPASTAIAVFNPGEAFVMALRDDLQARGIAVGALTVTQRPSQSTAPELAAVVSPRLADLLIPTNQQSNNLYAEALLKQLGYPVEGGGGGHRRRHYGGGGHPGEFGGEPRSGGDGRRVGASPQKPGHPRGVGDSAGRNGAIAPRNHLPQLPGCGWTQRHPPQSLARHPRRRPTVGKIRGH
jgi:PBP4 family serine-type D-alanyl-D-alanine carboxypeptidase